MTFRQFNAVFRPLVNRAWLAQCESTHVPPNNRTAKDVWYREQIYSSTGGRIRSTRDATQRELNDLIERFQLLSGPSATPRISGWSDAQNLRFADLAEAAWQTVCRDGYQGDFDAWLDEILFSAGVENREAPGRKESFDRTMAHLAVIANDRYWLQHTAEAAEVRMRWQIRRFMGDLEWLQKRDVDISYVQAIWRQAQLQPDSMDEAPASILAKALAMLDTHIRRLCKDYGIRPMELPSRAHPHASPITIRESNHHLHVGHALEHCAPVQVDAETDLPF
jgi:hypothetical protein